MLQYEIIMHELLRLQHHRHTAKRLRHHHTSYRGLLLLVLTLALSMVAIHKTSAQYIDVNAQINAPVPTSAPTIINPLSGAQFTEESITVNGSCEILTPAYTVTLWLDTVFAGSVPCKSDGTYSLSVSMQPGTHMLRTGSINLTGQNGPDGAPITVVRVAPANPAPPVQPPVPPPAPRDNPADTPLEISTLPPTISFGAAERILFSPDKPFELEYEIREGTAPFRMNIDWGDGTKETRVVESRGKQQLDHVYKFPGSYTIKLSLIDYENRRYEIVLSAQTFARPTPLTTIPSGSTGSDSGYENFYLYVWGAYAGLVIGLVTFWLIEHHNLLNHAHTGTLKRQGKTIRKRKR